MGLIRRIARQFVRIGEDWRSSRPRAQAAPVMNLSGFAAALAATPFQWRLASCGSIRTSSSKPCPGDYHDEDDCPITAVAHHRTGRAFCMNDWYEAADAIVLPRELGVAVVHAADLTPPYDESLRELLLIATGLAKPEPPAADPLDAELASLIASRPAFRDDEPVPPPDPAPRPEKVPA